MKPITFENLRRLMGGGRKKKEKESSFKRSDSFKRISIRKSYLDRGKKKNISKLEVATQTATEEEETSAGTKKVDSSVQVDKDDLCPTTKNESKYKAGTSRVIPGESVIAYGQWLRGIRKEDVPASSGIKGSERTIIYVPASDEAAPPTVIRQLSSSPVLRKKSPGLQRKESNDSAVEMFPWGDSTEVKKSPLLRRRSRQSPVPLMPDSGTEELCSLSISLGRIWMDAPPGMAPRSLELPKSSAAPQPVHHSLDSALKDLRDDPIVMNRLQKRATPPVGRTLSSTSNTTAFSSKDSGFSFSISAPKLSDFHANFAPSSRGFFRKKQPKPKLSVSRDGYFKRTSGALSTETNRSSLKRKSSRKKKKGRKRSQKKSGTAKSDLYQVVGRPTRCLRSLKLDPMIFVPPERRKPCVDRKSPFKNVVPEIRTFDNSIYNTESTDEGLYESLDYLSDEQPLSRISLEEDEYEYFTCATPVSEKSVESAADSDEWESPYVPVGVPKRKAMRPKRGGLSHKRSITYVVKPTIIRAPSTLRRAGKKGEYLPNDFPVQDIEIGL